MSNLVPINNVSELLQVGKMLETSGMFGTGNSGQGMVIAATCLQENISFLQFKRTYHIVQGVPSMRSDAMLAGMCKMGGCYKILSRTPDKAEIFARFKDAEGTFGLTWDEAKQEKFVYGKDGKTIKDNYATPRARMQMLWARVVSDAVRAVAPEVVAGIYTPEETADFSDVHPEEKNITPPAEKPMKAKKKEVTVDTKPETETATEAETVIVEAEVVEPDQAIDYNIVPFGVEGIKGKRWDQLTASQLMKFRDKAADRLEEKHLTIINKILGD